MPCLKIVPESYANSDALDCLIRYIYSKSYRIGGLSVDPAHAAEQMKLVKSSCGTRRMVASCCTSSSRSALGNPSGSKARVS